MSEPLGGAHRDPEQMLQTLRGSLPVARRDLSKLSGDKRLEARYQRLMAYGKYKESARR